MTIGVKENKGDCIAAALPAEAPQTRVSRSPISVRLIPYFLAVFFAFWGLRGVTANNIIDTDAARHAMNGAFVHDFLLSGQWTHPIHFAEAYYGRLPALSMPYHPPLFPAIEAIFFAVFGVNLLTARLVIALAAGLSAFLFYRLVEKTSTSPVVPACCVAAFCFWRFAQLVSSDVMLEFPSLVFILLALHSIRDLNRFTFWRGAVFAFLAGAAIWTKQHAVLLVAFPFLYILLARRWRLLASKPVWITTALAIVPVAGLSMLSSLFRGTGTDQVVQSQELGSTILHHLEFYWTSTVASFGWMGASLLVICAASALVITLRGAPKPGLALHLAWAFSAFAVLLLLGPYDPRYLFFVYPPAAAIVFEILFRASTVVMPPGRAWLVPAALAMLCTVTGLTMPANFLSGPAEAAAVVLNSAPAPRRVLYCGSTDGNFIFSVRSLDSHAGTVVISGDKLPPRLLQPAAFGEFAVRYGISRVVIEQSSNPQSCDAIRNALPASLVLDRVVPLNSSLPRWHGTLGIYRVLNFSNTPENTLTLPIPRIGGSVEVTF